MATKKRTVEGARLTFVGDAQPLDPNQFVNTSFVQPEAAAAEAPAQERSWGRVAGDVGISALKGAIGVPEAAVGLADLVTGGYAGKAAEAVGFRPGDAKAMLDEGYSDQQKEAFRKVHAAQGLGDTFMAAVQNPSVVGHSIVESLPLMGAGGVVGRGAMAMAPRIGAGVAGAAGEGAVMAGSAAETIRQQTPDGLLTAGQAGLAGATGVLGAGLGVVGAKVAKALGVADVDTMLVASGLNQTVAKGFTRRVLEGAAAEGFLEELPQSVMEQVLQNQALGKPLDEGVDQAAVLGLLSGSAMGGGANALSGRAAPAPAAGEPVAAQGLPGVPVTPAPVPDDAGVLTRAAAKAPMSLAAAGLPGMEAPAPAAPAKPAPDIEAILARMHDDAAAEAQSMRDFSRETSAVAPPAPAAALPSGAAPAAAGPVQDGDVLTPKGLPFKTKAAAVLAQKKGAVGDVVPVDGGFVVRGTADVSATSTVPSVVADAAGAGSDIADRGLGDALGVRDGTGEALPATADAPGGQGVAVPPAGTPAAPVKAPPAGVLKARAKKAELAPAPEADVSALRDRWSSLQLKGVKIPPVMSKKIANGKLTSREHSQFKKMADDFEATLAPAFEGHTMERDDFTSKWVADQAKRYGITEAKVREGVNLDQLHMDFIEDALEAGKTVDPKVLTSHKSIDAKEYPLAAKLVADSAPPAPVKKKRVTDTYLQKNGEPVENMVDAQRRFNAGERVFLFHEQDETFFEAKNIGELDNYAPDQMLALPADQAPAVKSPVDAAPAATPAADKAPEAEAATSTAKKPRPSAKKAYAEAEAARAKHFTPGHIVRSYGGFDEVLEYKPGAADGSSWAVRVHEVKKVGNEWVRQGKAHDARWHATNPDARELKQGPIAKVSGDPTYSHPRADGQPFPDVPARGAKQAPAEVETSSVEPKVIEDAGEKIGGARKDKWKQRGLAVSDLDEMSETEGAELAVKANVWKPDYEAMVEGGAEPVAAALVKIVYDGLAARPRKDTPAARRDYVTMMQHVREVYSVVKTEADFDAAKNNLLYDKLQWTLGRDGDNVRAKANATGIEDLGAHLKKAQALLFSVYKGRADPFYIYSHDKSKAKRMVADGFPAKGEPWKTRMTVRAEGGPGLTPRGVEIVMQDAARVGTPVTEEQARAGVFEVRRKAGGLVAIMPTRIDAEAAAKAVYEREKKAGGGDKPEPSRPHLDTIKREGLPARIERDVSQDDFLKDFGFRGVEFGNWSAQDERQRILNMAYDGLADLAQIMGVPMKAMSLNGQLGMAFGARGGGKFLAHYEPGKLVINMTKLRGGGSLAHEWAHALDHYFGELDQPNAYTSRARGASGWYQQRNYTGMAAPKNLRPELAAAFDKVMSTLFQKHITKAEMVRELELKLDKAKAMVANEESKTLREMYERSVASQEANLVEARKQPEDKTFIGRKESDYAQEAQKLSGKSENGYWLRPTEMFARAFESWVFDRLTAMGAKSDYLVHGVESDRFAGGAFKGNPYPAGVERDQINKAFDALAGEIKTKNTDKGVAMFMRAPGWDAAVDKAIAAAVKGEDPGRGNVDIGSPSPSLQAAGIADQPLQTSGAIISKAHFDHGVKKATLKRIPDMLDNPVMVFKSDSVPGNFVVITDEWMGARPLTVVLKPTKNLENKAFNFVPSAYPREQVASIQGWLDKGLLTFIDQKQSPQWFNSAGLQLPRDLRTTKGLQAANVATEADVVKPDAAPDTPLRRGADPESDARLVGTQQFIDDLVDGWSNAPDIIVARNLQDPLIPAIVREADDSQKSQGAQGEVHGFFLGGKVYIVADALRSPSDAITVLAHEALGHYGLQGFFGEALAPIKQQIVAMRRKEVLAKAKEYGLDPRSKEDLLYAAEEVLAEMAQNTPTLGYVKRAIAAIRNWLRDHVPGFGKMTLSDADIIQAYILPARGWVVRGRDSGVSEPGPAMFSRGAAGNVLADPRGLQVAGREMVADLFGSAPGRISWWHKTVGTPHNLARRSPLFKRVYDSVQNFLEDVSAYATEAADLAPSILPKLESWRDIARSPITAADNKAIAAPIFEGTLIWTRDESGKPVKMAEVEDAAARLSVDQKAQRLLRGGHVTDQVLRMWRGMEVDKYEAIIDGKYERDVLKAGIVWKDDELRSMFKLTPEQVKLYREFRAATDRSLTNLAISDMLRFAGKDGAAVRDQVLAAGSLDKASEILRDHLLEHAELAMSIGDEKRNATLIDTAEKVIDKADQVRQLMERGYAPLSRHGHYTLDVLDEKGERVYFGMFESNAEASRMARKLRAEFPKGTFNRGTVSEKAYELFAGVSPETLELFGDMLGLEAQGEGAANAAFQTYLKLARNNRSAMKRLIERKGVAGFSEDAGRVLAGFVYSNARQTASNLHMGEMTEAANEVAKEEGELKDQAISLTSYVKNPTEEAQALRGLLFAQYLGGSVASAIVNMTQPFAVTMPYLSQYGGAAKAAGQTKKALADVLKKTTGDAALDAALKKAEKDGIVAPQEVHQLMAQAQGRSTLKPGDGTMVGDAGAKASNALSKLTLAWGKLFGAAEQFNRRVTFIAAYRTAVEQKMADPVAFAEKAIADTQFTYNRGNKPQWARGAIGGTLFTFKQYSISYVELLQYLATEGGPEGKKAALFGLAMLFLMGGAGGLPFAEDVDDVVDGALQRMGYNFSTKQAKKEFFAKWLGEGGGRFVEYGLSGLPGVPIDVSGRLGMGNLIPGTGLLTKKQDHTRDVTEIIGPAGDFGSRIFESANHLLQGEVKKAVETVSPTAARNLAKAYDMQTTGMYRDMKGRKVIDVDGYDAVSKALGFQPNDVARVQDATWLTQTLIGQVKLREAEIADKWAIGIFEKDEAKVKKALEQMKDWNAANPKTPIKINRAQVAKRVNAMREDKVTRMAKTAPKEIRATVQRELATTQ